MANNELVAEEIIASEIQVGDRIRFVSSSTRRGYVERTVAKVFSTPDGVGPGGVELSFSDDPDWCDADFYTTDRVVVYRPDHD